MLGRRSIIKTVGSLATLSTVSSVAATAQEKSLNDNPEQIDEEVVRAYGKNGSAGVKQVMESRGLEYAMSDADPPSDSEVGTQRRFHEYDLSSYVIKLSDEKIRIQLIADLSDLKVGFSDTTYVDDIMGFSYRTEHWTSVDTSTRTPSEYHDIDPWEGSLNGGYAVRVKIKPEGIVREDDSKHTFLTAVSLKSDTGTPNTVIGHYCHNSAISPSGKVNSVSSSGVGMNVDLSIGAEKFWQEGHDVDVEEAPIFD